LEDLEVDGRIILRWITEKHGMMAWTGFIWLRMGSCGSNFENGYETSDPMKGGKFLD
jgi:hypothetical protein